MKIGLLGAGRIARTMAATVCGMVSQGMDGIEAWSVGARDLARARELADEFGFAHAYGSYEEMLSDPELDLVYIATPHSHHYAHAKLCLEHGKNVLCEKAFTVNAAQARALMALAKEKGLLITEAIWPRYMPSRQIIDELLSSGIIGEPTMVSASLCYALLDKERMTDPALAGGALLDIGIYALNFALMAFGEDYDQVTSAAVLTPRGVDCRESITLTWKDGRMAVLHSDMTAQCDRRGIVIGSKGYLEVENINNPEVIRVFDLNYQLVEEHPVPTQITGYEYEVLACRDALATGQLECPAMPHQSTLRVMELMDSLRASWGVVYPCE